MENHTSSVNWARFFAIAIIAFVFSIVMMAGQIKPAHAQYLVDYDAHHSPETSMATVGEVFTETFTVRAPDGASEVGIRFGFWNYTEDPELDAQIFQWGVNSPYWSRCNNNLQTTGLIQCTAGNLQPGQQVTFTFHMRALQFGKVRTAAYLWRDVSPIGESTSTGLSHEWQINDKQYNAMVSLPEIMQVKVGKVYTIPVMSSDLSGMGVIAYDTTLHIDPLVRIIRIVPGKLSFPNFDSTEIHVGKYKISNSGTIPLEGVGELFSIVVTPIGDGGMQSPMQLQEFTFNAGNPSATILNGILSIYGYTLSGKTVHRNGNAISGVLVELSDGNRKYTRSSNIWGDFSIGSWQDGYNALSFSKQGALEDSVNAEDAAKIQACVLLQEPCDGISMDVDGNGKVQGYDAALTAQHDAGINNPHSLIGDWRFIDTPRVFNDLQNDQSGLRIEGVPIGDANDSYGNIATAAFALNEHKIELNGNVTKLSVKIDGPTFRSMKLMFDGANIISASADGFDSVVNEGTVVLYGTSSNSVVINLEINGNVGDKVKLHYVRIGDTIQLQTIEPLILGPGPDPIEEEMPILERDKVFMPTLYKEVKTAWGIE